jgi:hypothetical protein
MIISSEKFVSFLEFRASKQISALAVHRWPMQQTDILAFPAARSGLRFAVTLIQDPVRLLGRGHTHT